MWVCEFCGHHNVVDLMEDEIPSSDVVTYMLQPAPCTTSSGKSGRDESLVIFCIDISGSMCVTSEVNGHAYYTVFLKDFALLGACMIFL